MSSPAYVDYGKLLLAFVVLVLGSFVLAITGDMPLLIISEGTAGGLVIIAFCAVTGSLLCWFGRRSGLVLAIGFILIGIALWCSVQWIRAAT
jgi:hypothetical protein